MLASRCAALLSSGRAGGAAAGLTPLLDRLGELGLHLAEFLLLLGARREGSTARDFRESACCGFPASAAILAVTSSSMKEPSWIARGELIARDLHAGGRKNRLFRIRETDLELFIERGAPPPRENRRRQPSRRFPEPKQYV